MVFRIIIWTLFLQHFSTQVYAAPTDSLFRISINNKQLTAPEVLSIYIQQKSLSCEELSAGEWLKSVCRENHLKELNPVTVIGEGATELSQLIGSEKDELAFGISLGHKRPLWLELTLNTPGSGHSSVTPTEYSSKEITIALSNLAKKKTPAIYFEENKEIFLKLTVK